MEILITGATGFLGKLITKELSKGNTLFSLSRTSGDYKFCLENEIPNFGRKFDLIVHAAGKAHSIPRTIEEKKQFHDVNVLGTLNLLKGLEKVGLPEQFVFVSSVSVYGQDSGVNIDEDHLLQAKDPYGLSKIAAEELITKWCKQNNVFCTVLRLPLLAGENPPGNLGAMVKAIKKGYYFNIGGGTTKKSIVLAEDVAKFIPKAAALGGIYNLTDGVHPTFRELSLAIAKRQQLNLPLILAKLMAHLGDFVGDKAPINSSKLKKITNDLTFDDSKARKLLNWNPQSVLAYLEHNNI